MSAQVTVLPSGLRVVSETMPGLKTAAVGVWVDAGARHEAAEVNGIAHLLEHMAFKGTERRSARQIAEEIEAVGGHLNAYTSREQTAYYARVLSGDLALAVDIISDILQHPAFEAGEIERERHVVIQEIGQAEDTPDDIVFDHLQECAYPDQPLGRPILGTEELVASLGATSLPASWVATTARHAWSSPPPAVSNMRQSSISRPGPSPIGPRMSRRRRSRRGTVAATGARRAISNRCM